MCMTWEACPIIYQRVANMFKYYTDKWNQVVHIACSICPIKIEVLCLLYRKQKQNIIFLKTQNDT